MSGAGDQVPEKGFLLDCWDGPSSELSESLRKHLEQEVDFGRVEFQKSWEVLVNGSSLDLLEGCAPWDSPLSQAVRETGGRAMSIGVHNGYDLSTSEGFRRVLALVRETKPRYIHVSPLCGPWTSLQNLNVNRQDQQRRLIQERVCSRRLLKNCCRLIAVQRQEVQCGAGCSFEGHAGGEHPHRASSWKLPEMKEMVRLCGGKRFVVHGCEHGLRDATSGKLHKKPWGWFTSLCRVQQALERPCTHSQEQHEPIQGGRRSAQTATYPYLLCRRFAKALMEELYQGEAKVKSRTPWRSSKILVGSSEEEVDPFAESDMEQHEAEPEGVHNQPAEPPNAGEEPFVWDPEIKRKLTLVHRNLGHPNKQVLLRMLRDAHASAEVLRQAEHFECPECLQRGRQAPTRPSTVPHHVKKWECMSIDTFWWHTPKEALKHGETPDHMLCLSMLDEACDYHAVHVARSSRQGPLSNMTGPEFKRAMTLGWLRYLPAPRRLRYDEEGFLKRLDVVEWLEGIGVKLEPVAGESPWQIGKHSEHIQTLKENMNLLCMELQNKLKPEELLGLSVQAKNSMHNVRGFSPHQWAFGQGHSRVSSFLQQSGHLPNSSAREDATFEESLQNELKAQKLFLEIDARRRVQRALRARCRRLREFRCGDLVCYYRRGRKEGSRYGGHWYGPARVLCQEKTGGDGGVVKGMRRGRLCG